MVKRVNFGGHVINFPDNFSQDQIDQIIQERAPEYRKIFGIKEPTKPEGFFPALSSGLSGLEQQLYSAGEGAAGAAGLTGLAKLAGERAAAKKAEAEKALPDQMSFGKAQSLSDYWQAAKEAAGTSLPQMAPSVVAGALTGGELGGAAGPIGMGIGALLGGTLAGIPQFYGSNRERQKDENSGIVKSEGAAILSAIPQAAMDSLLGKFIPGAGHAVSGGILTRAVKSGAEGVLTEVPTEVGQQILERLQAGLPLDNDQAISEYKEAAIAAGVLGGGIGSVSGAAQKRAMTAQELRALAGQEQSDQLQQNINDARMAAPAAVPAVAPPASSITSPTATTATTATTAPATTPATGATAPNAPATAPPATAPPVAPAAEPADAELNQQAAETAAQIEAKPAAAPAPALPKGESVRATFLNEDGTDADVAQEMQLIGNEPDGRPILITPEGLTIRPRLDRIKIEPLEVTAKPAPQAAQMQDLPSATELTAEPATTELPAPDQATDLSEAIKTLIENADLKATPAPAENVPSMVQPETAAPASKRVRQSQAQPDTLTPEQEVELERAINSMPAGTRTINTKALKESLGFKTTAIFDSLQRMAEAGKVEKTGKGPYMRVETPVSPAATETIETPATQPAPQPAAEAQPNVVQAAFDLARSLARKTREGEAVDPLDFADQYSLDPELARDVLSTNPLFKEEDGIFYRTDLPATDEVVSPAAPPPVKPKAAAPKKAAPAPAPAPEVATEPKQKAARKPKATPEQLQAARDSIIAAPVKTKLDLPALMKQHDMTMEEVRGVARSLVDEGFVVLPSKSKGYIRTAKEAPKAAAPKVEKAAAPKVSSQKQAVPEIKPIEQTVEKPVEPKAAPRILEAAPAKTEVKAEPKVSEAIAPKEKPKAAKPAPKAEPKAEAKPEAKPAAAAKPATPAPTRTTAGKIDLLALVKEQAAEINREEESKIKGAISAAMADVSDLSNDAKSGDATASDVRRLANTLVKDGIISADAVKDADIGSKTATVEELADALLGLVEAATPESVRAIGVVVPPTKKAATKVPPRAPAAPASKAEAAPAAETATEEAPKPRPKKVAEPASLELPEGVTLSADEEKLLRYIRDVLPENNPIKITAGRLLSTMGMKPDEIRVLLGSLESKGLVGKKTGVMDGKEFTSFQSLTKPAKPKAAPKPRAPRSREERRAATERVAATKALDLIKQAEPEEEVAAEEEEPRLSKQEVEAITDPEKRIVAILTADPSKFTVKDFIRYTENAIAYGQSKDARIDSLETALAEMKDLEKGDMEDAHSLFEDAVEQTSGLLPDEVMAEAFPPVTDIEEEVTERTTEERLSDIFGEMERKSYKMNIGDVMKFAKKLTEDGIIKPTTKEEVDFWKERFRVIGSKDVLTALRLLEQSIEIVNQSKAAQKEAAKPNAQRVEEAVDNLESGLLTDGKQMTSKDVVALAENLQSEGLISEEGLQQIRDNRKDHPQTLAGGLIRVASGGEYSTRGATAPETEAKTEAKPKRTKRRKGKKKGEKVAAEAPKLSPEEIAAQEARRAEAQQFLDERLAKMEASGPFGQKAAAEVRRVLADGEISNVQAHHAFVMAEISTKLLSGTGANPDIRFLKSVDYDGRRLRRGNPDALAGLIEFSLNDDPKKSVLGYSRETAAHEPFHVLQDLMEQYDPATSKILFGQRTGIDPDTGHGIYKGGAFRDGMVPSDINPSIQRTLKSLSPEPGGGSYWNRFLEDYNKAPDTPLLDKDGNPIPNLKTEFAKQRESMAYIFGMLADAKTRGFSTNSLDPAFKRFVNFLAAFREKMGSFLRGEGYRSTDQVLEDYISGERQKGYGEEVDRAGSQEFSGRGGEFSVRGGRISEQGEMAINRGQLQNASKNLTIMQRLKKLAQRVFDPLADMTGRDEYLMQRYRALGNVSRLEKEAKAFYDTIKKATDAQKKAIFTYLTTRGAIVPNLPPALQKAAVDVKAQINKIGEDMERRGMISQETLDEYKDSYLPRLYMKYLLEGKNISTGLRVGSQEYLNQRKKLTAEERVALGEVEDPSFLSFAAMYRPQRDMAIMDFLSGIAKTGNDWVLPDTLIDWNGRKVTAYWLADEAHALRERMKYEPDPKKSKSMGKTADRMQKLADPILRGRIPENYKQLPKTSRYGALKGMTVRKEIYDDLVGAAQFNADASMVDSIFGDRNSSLARGTQFWKMTKTILNPPTQVRNFISNAVMLNLSGVSPFMVGPRMLQAMKEMRTNGPAWQIAKEYGVEATGFNEQEMREVNEALQEYLSKNTTGVMNVKVLANIFSKVSNKAGNWYQWSEQVFKTAKIIDELEKNKVYSMPKGSKARQNAEGAAALQAHKWFFDYSLVPPSIRSLRTMPFGAPFITYYYKALPVLAEVAMNPRTAFRFAPYVALATVLPAAIASSYDVDDDDIEKLRMSMSEQLRDKPNMLLIPWKDEHNNWQFLDAGYFFPWSMFLDTANKVSKGDVSGALSSVGALSSPALSAVTAIKTNIDPFSGREIINKGDPPHEQMMSLIHYVNNLISPPFLTQYGFAGKLYDNATNSGMNRYGEPNQDAAQITGRFFGFNFYPVVPEMQRGRNIVKMQGDIRDVKMRMSYTIKDLSLTDEERRRAIEDYTAEILKRTEDLVQYAKDSDIPGVLKKKQE